jgi:hypothetical protein
MCARASSSSVRLRASRTPRPIFFLKKIIYKKKQSAILEVFFSLSFSSLRSLFFCIHHPSLVKVKVLPVDRVGLGARVRGDSVGNPAGGNGDQRIVAVAMQKKQPKKIKKKITLNKKNVSVPSQNRIIDGCTLRAQVCVIVLKAAALTIEARFPGSVRRRRASRAAGGKRGL